MLKRKDKDLSEEEREKKKIIMIETSQNREVQPQTFNVLTTIYSLNNSNSKRISVGLVHNDTSDTFYPAIQLLTNQYSYGLSLSVIAWTSLLNNFEQITNYFNNHVDTPEKIALDDDTEIRFTTSYGVKSILFDKIFKPSENKRKKCYAPGVVLQRRTFHGLKKAAICVDERFRRLERVASDVNNAKDYIVEELLCIVKKEDLFDYDNEKHFKSTMEKNTKTIQLNVQDQFDASKDAYFLKYYFDILYLELTTVFINNLQKLLVKMYENQTVNLPNNTQA